MFLEVSCSYGLNFKQPNFLGVIECIQIVVDRSKSYSGAYCFARDKEPTLTFLFPIRPFDELDV